MQDHAGDFEVWRGIVPDFADPEARRIFADYHREALIEKGVDGFKLDECDNSDYTGGWSFPNASLFPSGLDGEQMHALYGVLYQQTMLAALAGRVPPLADRDGARRGLAGARVRPRRARAARAVRALPSRSGLGPLDPDADRG